MPRPRRWRATPPGCPSPARPWTGSSAWRQPSTSAPGRRSSPVLPGAAAGGVLSISDISAQRWPVTPAELLAGLTQLRVFGLRRTMAITAGQIAAEARAAGLAEVQVRRCGDRVIAPALRLTAERLKEHHSRTRRAARRRSPAAVAGQPALATPDHRLSAAPRDPPVTSPAACAGQPRTVRQALVSGSLRAGRTPPAAQQDRPRGLPCAGMLRRPAAITKYADRVR